MAGKSDKGGMRVITRKNMVVFFAIVLLAVLSVSVFLQRYNASDFLTLSGLSSNPDITANLEQSGKVLPLTLTINKNAARFTKPSGTFSQASYKLSLTIRQDDGYKDISVIYDRPKNMATMVMRGFEPDGRVRIERNNDVLLDGLHFDWSGKIDISVLLENKGAARFCVIPADDFKICHSFPEGRQT